MPKATCVWLIDNTALTFDQIGDFCGMHALEVQAIADGEVAQGIIGRDPIAAAELTRDEIARCEAEPSARLQMLKPKLPRAAERTKGPRYTAMAKRQDKPDGIAWLVRHHPELADSQIGKLLGTTKNTIAAVRDRTHWNSANIKARHPVDLGLCTYLELNAAVEKARAKLTPEERAAIEARDAEPAEEEEKRSDAIPSIAELFGRPSSDD
jgi:hypothetical protein